MVKLGKLKREDSNFMRFLGYFLLICFIISLVGTSPSLIPVLLIAWLIRLASKKNGYSKKIVSFSDDVICEKKEKTEFILCILFGWCGGHKFYAKKTGIGILYFLTFGLSGIGWVVDIVLLGGKIYDRYKFKKFENEYYKGEYFFSLKKSVLQYIQNCNELNKHILELKNVNLDARQIDYGKALYSDKSQYNYTRPEFIKHTYQNNVYNCSRNICDNARMQPFKYICKYFEISINDKTLSEFESLLNNYEAAIDGAKLLDNEKRRILEGIEEKIPPIIKQHGYTRFQQELGFEPFTFPDIDFPKYKFLYVSSGGNASTECEIVMDIDNLNKFVYFLSERIKFSQSIAGQRALMTSSLRKKILARDNYTCQKCGNSIQNEPNLLLEIDHKIPLSKGGLTTEQNLQVLCWKCNRSKGAKLEA